MSDERYHIIFRGEIAADVELATVKQNLSRMFKLDVEKIDAMFSGKAITIKKNLDHDTALKYQNAMKKAGAVISVRSAVPSDTNNEQASDNTNQALSVAELGADVLRPEELPKQAPVQVDVSAIHMGSVYDDSPLEADRPIAPPAPLTDHIDLAELGSDMGERGAAVPLVQPNIDHLNLASPGELVEPSEPAPALELDLTQLQLDAPGVTLVEREEEVPPPELDLSKLRLENT